MQLREVIASPITLIISFNFSIARVVKHTLDDFSNILLEDAMQCPLSTPYLSVKTSASFETIFHEKLDISV